MCFNKCIFFSPAHLDLGAQQQMILSQPPPGTPQALAQVGLQQLVPAPSPAPQALPSHYGVYSHVQPPMHLVSQPVSIASHAIVQQAGPPMLTQPTQHILAQQVIFVSFVLKSPHCLLSFSVFRIKYKAILFRPSIIQSCLLHRLLLMSHLAILSQCLHLLHWYTQWLLVVPPIIPPLDWRKRSQSVVSQKRRMIKFQKIFWDTRFVYFLLCFLFLNKLVTQ